MSDVDCSIPGCESEPPLSRSLNIPAPILSLSSSTIQLPYHFVYMIAYIIIIWNMGRLTFKSINPFLEWFSRKYERCRVTLFKRNMHRYCGRHDIPRKGSSSLNISIGAYLSLSIRCWWRRPDPGCQLGPDRTRGLASDWLRVITWPGLWPLIGPDRTRGLAARMCAPRNADNYVLTQLSNILPAPGLREVLALIRVSFGLTYIYQQATWLIDKWTKDFNWFSRIFFKCQARIL